MSKRAENFDPALNIPGTRIRHDQDGRDVLERGNLARAAGPAHRAIYARADRLRGLYLGGGSRSLCVAE